MKGEKRDEDKHSKGVWVEATAVDPRLQATEVEFLLRPWASGFSG